MDTDKLQALLKKKEELDLQIKAEIDRLAGHTPQTIAKSEKTKSPELRARIAASMRKRWAERRKQK
jgi:hypothetical protein